MPPHRRSTQYVLVHEGGQYPPKYVVSLAVKEATGQALDPHEFGGGAETNSLLRRLGFSVVPFSRGAVDTQRQPATPPRSERGMTRETELVKASSETTREKSLIGRVVVCRQTGDPLEGEAMLLDVLMSRWPKGLHLKFLITPGGFVVAPFPKQWSGGISWSSMPTDLDALCTHADGALSQTLTERVLRAARGKIDVLTVGIDLSRKGRQEHAELVAICELANRRILWTGKSYPTADQERHLVQVVDLSTHLVEIADERVLVLGCHDLNMFSPRAWANQAPGGDRRKRCKQMRHLARRFKPTIVLHHPHTTDSPNIWRNAWGGLAGQLPGLRAWASGIGYHRWGKRPRAPLCDVLMATQGGASSVDFVRSAS